jgi:isoleucyl-tRNA synthetase
LPEIDRWILGELEEVKTSCLQAYANLEFHKVYQLLTQFCAVELSSQYIDITKDRLYCDRADSHRRRATQTAMHEIFESLCRLLAPIICFTAEEAWGHRRGAQADDSVHLQLFPAAHPGRLQDAALERVRGWIHLRATISQGIEAATKSNVIGNPLEARVIVTVPGEELPAWNHLASELEEFLILSELEFHAGSPGVEISVKVEKTTRERCERCWRHREDVGSNEAHPTLCGRCAEAVG